MTNPDQISTSEFVEYATFLCGAQWRDEISTKLGLPRKNLVMMLASGEEIPRNLAITVLNLLEEKLAEMEREQAILKDRIYALRKSSPNRVPTTVRSRGLMQQAC